MIEYECLICGCEFAVNREYLKQMEEKREYLTCPRNGKHGKIKRIDDYKAIMEERQAVQL